MQKFCILLLLLGITSLNSMAQDLWSSMEPLNHCKAVKLEYIQKFDSYEVRIPKKDDSKKYYIQTTVVDLNDLSKLTEFLNQASTDFCPLSDLTIQADYSEAVCQPFENQYSESYINLVRTVSGIINKDRDKVCENIIPYIKLQDEIEQLKQEDLVQIKKTKNILEKLLRLFVNSDTDKMIDHFNTCGGKKGSEKFVKNLILLEVRNACAVPKPQGMMSWEDAEKVASEIAKDYKNTSLIKLNGKTKEITKRTLLKFADSVTKDQVGALLSPFLDKNDGPVDSQVNGFIENLDAYKKLQNTKSDNLSDYVSYVYSVDVGIEVGKKAIPHLIKSNFKDKLPSNWNQERKDLFLEKVLLRTANKTFDECMKEEVEYTSFEVKNDDELISKRKDLKSDFCQKYPNRCKGTCDDSTNLLANDDSAGDTERIQGCVLKSITKTIKPLLTGIIRNQREEFKENFDLTYKMARDFSNKTWDTLLSCVNRRIDKGYPTVGPKTPANILEEDIYLQKIDTDDFQKYLLNCADLAENKVSKEFVAQLLLNEKALKSAFIEGNNQEDIYGNTHSEELTKKVEEITNSSFTPCLERQYRLIQKETPHGLVNKDTMICTPIVEMNASVLVVKKELESMIKNSHLENDSALKLTLKEYEACGDKAIENSIKDIGSITSPTPLNTVEDSKTYLEKNDSLFNCVENAIANVSFIIAGHEYDKIVEEQKGKLKNPGYMASLKNNVQVAVKSCFSSEINNINYYSYLIKGETNGEDTEVIRQSIQATSLEDAQKRLAQKTITYTNLKKQGKWPAFTSFNEDDGLTALQEKCEMVASQEVVPKLVTKEATTELKALIKDGFIKNEKQITEILEDEGNTVKNNYKISIPKSITAEERNNYILAQGLKLHIKKGGNMDSYIAELSTQIEAHAINKVHENLISAINTKTEPTLKKEISGFENDFQASCLQNIYNKFMKNAPDTGGDPITLNDLSNYLAKGLEYTYKKNPAQYKTEMSQFKSECDNFYKFKTQSDFYKSKFYEVIVKAEVYNQFKGEFKKEIMSTVDDLDKSITNPHADIKRKYAKKMRDELNNLFEKVLSEKSFESDVFKDGEVLNFAQRNLDKLLSSDPKIKAELTELLITKLFNNTKVGSFADEFSRIQVSTNIGIQGVTQAYEEANDKATFVNIMGWRIGPNNYAKKNATGLFSDTKKIDTLIDWNNIEPSRRAQYIKLIGHAGIIGATRKEEYNENMENQVINYYKDKFLKQNPTPRDTNPAPFQKMAENNANLAFSLKLNGLKSKLDTYISNNGFEGYNDYLEKLVETDVNNMKLIQRKKSSKDYFTKNDPNSAEVKKYLKDKLRSYHLTQTITDGIGQNKYSGGKTFEDKVSDEITKKTKDDLF